MWTCILPVASFLGNTIVLWNCTIVWNKCYSDATMVTWCHNSIIWHHNCSTMASINNYTWQRFLLLLPSGYSIWDTEKLKCDESLLCETIFCLDHIRNNDNTPNNELAIWCHNGPYCYVIKSLHGLHYELF